MYDDRQRRTNRHYRPSQSFPDVLSGIIVLAAIAILLGAHHHQHVGVQVLPVGIG